MKTVSSTYKQIIASNQTRNWLINVDFTFSDNTQLTVTEADLMSNTFALYSASSSNSSFDLGSAIINKCQFTLNNIDGDFDDYDFFNATAVVWIKLVGDSAYERMGFFTVDEPKKSGYLISIELLDNMWRFDTDLPTMAVPNTIGTLVSALCTECGVTLKSGNFNGSSFVINSLPTTEKMNCREMLQHLAMIGGNFCTMDMQGKLWLRWYDTASYDDPTHSTSISEFRSFFSYNVGTTDLTITGVKFTIDKVDYLIGTEGYVLVLENPLVNASNVQAVLNQIWSVVDGFTFRTFDLECIPDYAPEIGDCIKITNNGESIYSYLTNFTFKPSIINVALYAETPTRKLSKRPSKAVQSAVEIAQRMVDDKIGRYDIAAQMMNNLAVNAMGAYQDYEDLPTGGRVYYLSNRPITKSGGTCSFVNTSTVFKITGEGFFVSLPSDPPSSTRTWVNGYSQGELVVNVLKTIGVSADWIETGLLTDKNGYNYWDLDNNIFHLAANTSVGSGGTTLNDLALKTSTIVDVDVEYAKNQSSSTAPVSGWSTSSPQWEEGYYIWQRTKTTDGNGTASYSTAVCIQGAKGEDGATGATGVGVSAIVEQYYLSTSSSTPTGGSWSTTQPAWVSGKYIWTRSHITWTNNTTTDTDPVLAQAINGANQSVKNLDDSLNQQGVFNRLTNNGQTQGIYLSNNKLYINADYIGAGTLSANYIKGGILTLGGSNNTNGEISVKDANGNVIFHGDKDGISTTNLKVSGLSNFGDLKIGQKTITTPWGSTETVSYLYSEGYREIFYEFWSTLSSNATRNVYFSPYYDGWSEDVDITISCHADDNTSTGHDTSRVFQFTLYKWSGSSWTSQESRRYNSAGVEMDGKEDGFGSFSTTDKNYYRIRVVVTRYSWGFDYWVDLYSPQIHVLEITPYEVTGDFRGKITSGTLNAVSGNFDMANIQRLTLDGYIYSPSGNTVMSLTSSSESMTLHDTSNSNYLTIYPAQISKVTSGTAYVVTWSSSDERIKENIESLDEDLSREFIDGTETKKFKYKGADGTHYGMIAQEARRLLDGLGETDAQLEHSMGVPKEDSGIDDQRTIDYQEYIPHLINYVKQLRKEIDELKAEMKK